MEGDHAPAPDVDANGGDCIEKPETNDAAPSPAAPEPSSNTPAPADADGDVVELKALLATERSRRAKLNEQMLLIRAKVTEEVSRLESAINEAEARAAGLQARLDLANEEAEVTAALLAQREDTIDGLRRDAQHATFQFECAQGDLDEALSEGVELRGELAEAKAAVAELKDRVYAAAERAEALRVQLAASRAEVAAAAETQRTAEAAHKAAAPTATVSLPQAADAPTLPPSHYAADHAATTAVIAPSPPAVLTGNIGRGAGEDGATQPTAATAAAAPSSSSAATPSSTAASSATSSTVLLLDLQAARAAAVYAHAEAAARAAECAGALSEVEQARAERATAVAAAAARDAEAARTLATCRGLQAVIGGLQEQLAAEQGRRAACEADVAAATAFGHALHGANKALTGEVAALREHVAMLAAGARSREAVAAAAAASRSATRGAPAAATTTTFAAAAAPSIAPAPADRAATMGPVTPQLASSSSFFATRPHVPAGGPSPQLQSRLSLLAESAQRPLSGRLRQLELLFSSSSSSSSGGGADRDSGGNGYAMAWQQPAYQGGRTGGVEIHGGDVSSMVADSVTPIDRHAGGVRSRSTSDMDTEKRLRRDAEVEVAALQQRLREMVAAAGSAHQSPDASPADVVATGATANGQPSGGTSSSGFVFKQRPDVYHPHAAAAEPATATDGDAAPTATASGMRRGSTPLSPSAQPVGVFPALNPTTTSRLFGTPPSVQQLQQLHGLGGVSSRGGGSGGAHSSRGDSNSGAGRQGNISGGGGGADRISMSASASSPLDVYREARARLEWAATVTSTSTPPSTPTTSGVFLPSSPKPNAAATTNGSSSLLGPATHPGDPSLPHPHRYSSPKGGSGSLPFVTSGGGVDSGGGGGSGRKDGGSSVSIVSHNRSVPVGNGWASGTSTDPTSSIEYEIGSGMLGMGVSPPIPVISTVRGGGTAIVSGLAPAQKFRPAPLAP